MPNTTSADTVPTPLRPTTDDPVREAAPTFEWEAVPGATTYHLQVAPTETFNTLLFDSGVGDRTRLTVYDVVPEDGGTYYWRVRADTVEGNPSKWSPTTAFTTEEGTVAQAAQQSRSRSSDAPAVREPTEGAPVDGRSAEFHWMPVPAALRYEVQVARTADFDDPLTLEPGHATHLTLYSMLPVDGRMFFWRVRALRPNKEWTDWSAPTSFAAATDEDVISYQEEQEQTSIQAAKNKAHEEEAALAKRRREEEEFSPVLSAQTSPSASLGIASAMLVSFLITLMLVARAVM